MSTDRAEALSRQLARTHDLLRERLRSARGTSLLEHCLAFCAALTAHHEGEDQGLFAELRRLRPDLDPALTKLEQDHAMITSIIRKLRSTEDTSELDGLAAIMESHFRYEEKVLSAAVDQLPAGGDWESRVFLR